MKLNVPMGDIAVHFRGGAVIPVQPYAPVTRDVRYAPVTLVVTLPSKPAGAAGGAVPPYALDKACRDAHASNAGKLVSCGLLFMDGEADVLVVTPENSVQVWYVAVTAPDGKSGSIRSIVAANGGAAKGRLRVKEVHLLGVPATAIKGARVSQEAARKQQASVGSATVNGKPASLSVKQGTPGVLRLTGFENPAGVPLNVKWSTL